jgi:TfoX/Sxy family transcriptional regulator of competence genes
MAARTRPAPRSVFACRQKSSTKSAFRSESSVCAWTAKVSTPKTVTKQYVDQEARLRNLRAQEQQYLGILRKAATVKDTLEVSDKLNEVRGAIEERQAEFEALTKQVR